MSNIVYVTDHDFEEKVLKSELPVLVDFWAEWCGPCRSIAPLLEELADEYKNKVIIAKLNIEENTKYATEYGIRSIPTLISFVSGEKQETIMGADPSKIKNLVSSIAGE